MRTMLIEILDFVLSRTTRFYLENEDDGVFFITTSTADRPFTGTSHPDDLAEGLKLATALQVKFPGMKVEGTALNERVYVIVRPKGTPGD